MKVKKQFFIGLGTGWMSIISLIAVWIFLLPHSSFELDLTNQVIVLEKGEKVVFTYDNGCVNTDEPDTPVFTYIRENGEWTSRQIPEGFMSKNDEYMGNGVTS
jgi:hypothetical protein